MESLAYTEFCASSSVAPFPAILAALELAGPELTVKGAPGSRLQDADCAAVGATAAATRLAVLSLVAHEISDAGAAALVAEGRASSLVALNLSLNNIGAAGGAALAAALRGAGELEELTLDGNPLGEAGGVALAGLVESHPRLAQLRVARCDFGPDALIALATALAATASLRLLDVSEPLLFSRNEETAAHFARALRANASLVRLVMRKHPRTTDTTAEWLCDALLDNAALRQLDLSANPLGPPSGAAFAQALAAGAVLTHLELASCRLGDGGAAALAGALAAPDCALRHLDLRSNGIGEAGVAALMGALCAPGCALESLFLWGNPGLQPGPGAEAVMEALSSGAVRAVTDLQPFEVDGEAQVAMVRV
jgi:Ran GTPase-activating protein (RanGAP) involved in mRNA processing and transport